MIDGQCEVMNGRAMNVDEWIECGQVNGWTMQMYVWIMWMAEWRNVDG